MANIMNFEAREYFEAAGQGFCFIDIDLPADRMAFYMVGPAPMVEFFCV